MKGASPSLSLYPCPCFQFVLHFDLNFCFSVLSFVFIFTSERQNHARELVRKADLSQWDALVIMSGDGLLFEVLHHDTDVNQHQMDVISHPVPATTARFYSQHFLE